MTHLILSLSACFCSSRPSSWPKSPQWTLPRMMRRISSIDVIMAEVRTEAVSEETRVHQVRYYLTAEKHQMYMGGWGGGWSSFTQGRCKLFGMTWHRQTQNGLVPPSEQRESSHCYVYSWSLEVFRKRHWDILERKCQHGHQLSLRSRTSWVLRYSCNFGWLSYSTKVCL